MSMLSHHSSNGEEEDVLGRGIDADVLEHDREGDTRPFRDERPAFLAGLMGDLAAGREGLDLGQRKRPRPIDHAVDREPPIGKAAGQELLVGLGLRRPAVDRNHLRDLAAVELARHRGELGQEALSGVGEGLAEAVDPAAVRGNEPVAIGGAHGGAQGPGAGHGSEARLDQPSPGE